jgi:hypothetical protein
MVIWWSCLLMFIGAMVFIQTHFYPRIDWKQLSDLVHLSRCVASAGSWVVSSY